MKIEWLNTELTRARLTKGWFKKRQAIVVWKLRRESDPDDWDYESGARCTVSIERALDSGRIKELRVRKAAVEESNWVPVGLPVAKLLK